MAAACNASETRPPNLPSPMERCSWPKTPLDIAYHDEEWGVPVHDDRLLFELLILEGAQAGLSWSTILKKRENYRAALSPISMPGKSPATANGRPRASWPTPASSATA